VRPAHVTAQGLAVSENFTASLAHEFTITFLFDYFSFGDLSLLICLLHVALDRAFINDLFARRRRLVHGYIRRRAGPITSARFFALSHRRFRLLLSLRQGLLFNLLDRLPSPLLHQFYNVRCRLSTLGLGVAHCNNLLLWQAQTTLSLLHLLVTRHSWGDFYLVFNYLARLNVIG